MTTPYSHRQFFRKMPNADLERYFESNGISLDIDLSKLKENDADAILQAFIVLPEDQQSKAEAEFQEINAFAFDAGIQALVDEANEHGDEPFIETIATIDGFHAKVMWAFLEKKTYWRGATMFLHADEISPTAWKKRIDFPAASPCVEAEDIRELADEISGFFHTQQGKGRNCKVEPYRRKNKEYFFAYPEDFAQSGVEWISNMLETRARHPAFEIVFCYCEEEHSLDIYAPRNTKAVPDLQKIFAKAILKIDTLPNGELDKRVYDLEPLDDINFEFKITPDSGISSVVVTHLRLRLKHGFKRDIMLRADTQRNHRAVYDLLNELNLPSYEITQVGLKVTFEPELGQRKKTRRFNVTHPNSCALGYDGKDALIRDMLAQSGIEPALQKSSS